MSDQDFAELVCDLPHKSYSHGIANLTEVAQDEADATPASYLFVFDGKNAELKPVGEKSGTLELTMPLQGTNQLVTWFTDRPVRDAGHTTMRNFVGLWKQDGDESFAVSPPNAALSFNEKTLIVTMAYAEIIKTESGSQALKSTLILVKGKALTKLLQETKKLATRVKRAAKNTHKSGKTLGAVSFFIDSVNSPYGDASSSGDDKQRDHDETEDDTTNR